MPHHEHWLPVLGYEGYYEVSDLGRVRRVGKFGGAVVGRVITTELRKDGYRDVRLWRGGKGCRYRLHKLVTSAFLGVCPMGQEVNHKDRDRGNCRLDNLEYASHLDNVRHAIAEGGAPQYRRKRSRLLVVAEVREIRAKYASGVTMESLAETYQMSIRGIAAVVYRQTWRKVA